MDVAHRPSSVKKNDRMSTDHLKGGVMVKVFDQPDEGQADHHQYNLQNMKKPPVPISGNRRKMWNQKEGVTNPTSPVLLRKTRSEVMNKSLVTVGDLKVGSTSPRFLRKVKSIPSRSDVSKNASNVSGMASESVEMSFEKIKNDIKGSDECQEKLITSNVDGIECIEAVDELEKDEEDDEVADEKGMEEEESIEVEKKSYDVKETSVPDKEFNNIIVEDDAEDVKICENLDKKALVVPIKALEVKQPPRYVKRSAFYSDFNKSDHTLLKKVATNIAKPNSKHVSKYTKPNPSFTEPASGTPRPQEFHRHPSSGDRVQSLVDLVMWRDVSRSAFVFGTGIFMIISSSYTQDINISFVSVTSYLGLAYLALIFLFRSILRRGVTEADTGTVVGEDEAIWIVKLVLPYINEFFLTLRALFSGDPATTMKLAVVLFFLARCGSSITIWKMAKLGFIGVFTVPKVITLYYFQLKTQCKFWFERFKDAWDTCSHKKIIAGIIFSLIWNLCSVVARIWALFMVAVAFRYYQQLMAENEKWTEDDDADGLQKQQNGNIGDTSMEYLKEKKGT